MLHNCLSLKKTVRVENLRYRDFSPPPPLNISDNDRSLDKISKEINFKIQAKKEELGVDCFCRYAAMHCCTQYKASETNFNVSIILNDTTVRDPYSDMSIQ